MTSVYLHIPFCNKICSYCDFPKVLYNDEIAKKYLMQLKKEILDSYEGEKVKTLYIGGGTPSSLKKERLLELLEIIELFDLDESCEFTFECNINDINESLLKLLKKLGVNRLSIGIQSFMEEKLAFLKRKTSFEEAEEKILLARNMGFKNISADLMYALPGEKLKTLKKDLGLFLKLGLDHISTYSLIIEPHTMVYINDEESIYDEEEIKMYEYIIKKLESNGYEHYEISNFAKPGKKSKHNLTYWHNEEFYGFGLGATGYIKGFRYENTKSLEKYLNGEIKNIENLISNREVMENELILGFRLMKGINIKEFYKKYKVNIQEVFPVNPLVRSKQLIYDDGYLYVNPKHIYVLNEILLKLI